MNWSRTQHLTVAQLSLVKSLEEIEEKLLSSHKRLATLQQAIEIQTKDLGEIQELAILLS